MPTLGINGLFQGVGAGQAKPQGQLDAIQNQRTAKGSSAQPARIGTKSQGQLDAIQTQRAATGGRAPKPAPGPEVQSTLDYQNQTLAQNGVGLVMDKTA